MFEILGGRRTGDQRAIRATKIMLVPGRRRLRACPLPDPRMAQHDLVVGGRREATTRELAFRDQDGGRSTNRTGSSAELSAFSGHLRSLRPSLGATSWGHDRRHRRGRSLVSPRRQSGRSTATTPLRRDHRENRTVQRALSTGDNPHTGEQFLTSGTEEDLVEVLRAEAPATQNNDLRT